MELYYFLLHQFQHSHLPQSQFVNPVLAVKYMSAAGVSNMCQFTRTTDGARCPRKSTRMGPFCKAHAYYIKRKAERSVTPFGADASSSTEDLLSSSSSPPQEFLSPRSPASSASSLNGSLYSQQAQLHKSPVNGGISHLAHLESSAMATLIHFSSNYNSPRFGAMEAAPASPFNLNYGSTSDNNATMTSSPMFGASASSHLGFGMNFAGDNKASATSSATDADSTSMDVDSAGFSLSSTSQSSSSSSSYHVCEWIQEMAGGSMQCGLPVWNGGPFCHDHVMYQNQETLQAAEFLASLRSQTM
eukprot:TRINITY_DN8843_c0_g6_i1.p1 TRINITY_DN8843_c0_g6~~TRINITY_DN8843_c0_g6_i1.p1  ORF type:complete len:302 (+),score=44.56 TRINITY_DN8843_c0_g6_i1:548-1453(+)